MLMTPSPFGTRLRSNLVGPLPRSKVLPVFSIDTAFDLLHNFVSDKVSENEWCPNHCPNPDYRPSEDSIRPPCPWSSRNNTVINLLIRCLHYFTRRTHNHERIVCVRNHLFCGSLIPLPGEMHIQAWYFDTSGSRITCSRHGALFWLTRIQSCWRLVARARD